jgi:hypothetical protein
VIESKESGLSLSSDGSQSPPWASRWLWVAGIYKLTSGTLTIVWPSARTPEPPFDSVVFAGAATVVGFLPKT